VYSKGDQKSETGQRQGGQDCSVQKNKEDKEKIKVEGRGMEAAGEKRI
jgi:hypothetical protein